MSQPSNPSSRPSRKPSPDPTPLSQVYRPAQSAVTQWLRQLEQDQISRLQREAERAVHNLLARLSR